MNKHPTKSFPAVSGGFSKTLAWVFGLTLLVVFGPIVAVGFVAAATKDALDAGWALYEDLSDALTRMRRS